MSSCADEDTLPFIKDFVVGIYKLKRPSLACVPSTFAQAGSECLALQKQQSWECAILGPGTETFVGELSSFPSRPC